MTKTVVSTMTGGFWLIAGFCIIVAALGLFGFMVPATFWRQLAGIGAIIYLIPFNFYAHPHYAIGIGANIAIIVVLLWGKCQRLKC